MNSLRSCRVQRVCVCVCVSCGGFCLAPVPASILGRGCGCARVARAGSRCPGSGRVTAVVGCQDDERPSGTQGAEPRRWSGTCRRSRAQQNRDKSLKETDSREQHHAPEDAVRGQTHTHTETDAHTHTHTHTHTHVRIPACILLRNTNTNQYSLKQAKHFPLIQTK